MKRELPGALAHSAAASAERYAPGSLSVYSTSATRGNALEGLPIALRACRNIGAQSVVGTVDEFCDRLVPAMNRSVFALAAMGAIPIPPARLAPHELIAPEANIAEPANQLRRRQATACSGPFGGRLVNRSPLT